jgi:hypothetical protein
MKRGGGRDSKSEIDEQVPGTLSLMPENVGTTLEQPDLLDLVAFLLSKRATP